MKFGIAIFVVQALAIASSVAGTAEFWANYVESVNSFTPKPTPPPTPPPTAPPTPPPTPEPTEPPTRSPVPGQTPDPTPPPTPEPTPPPTPGPTPPPTPAPTLPPTLPPTSPPTGECMIDSCVNCTAVMNTEQIECEAIPVEDKPVCECEECVRELKFKYTGLGCSAELASAGKCVDQGPNPFVAGYRITSCTDPTIVFATGEAQQGDFITVGAAAGTCLEPCMDVTIAVPTGVVTQNFEIDSQCGGDRGLVLVNDYGAFESIGYSCSETDTHNCIQGISYGLKVCNTGATDETIYEWFLTIDDEEIDLLQDIPPQDVMLSPGECYYDTYEVDVDRCDEFETCVDVKANATNPVTGLPPNCPGVDEIKFGWEKPPTLPPTSAPTPFPSPAPSPAPSSSCIIDINLTGCPQYNSSLDNNCDGRPQVITFRYNGGGCAQSDNLQPRQKFQCDDPTGQGPPLLRGTTSFITAVPTGGNDLYFAGTVPVNGKYTLNADKTFDKLSADMTIEIFDFEGGTLLQQVNLHLSCSQPLFLFDKFGASQVTEWIETDGRVVSDRQTDVQTGTIEVKLDSSSEIVKPVRLLEMTVLTNTMDEPIDYTDQVAGVVLEPGQIIELPGFGIDIELTERTRYTFFTTLIGETLDGTNQCNGFSFLECTIGFNLNPVFPTEVPTASPTITPFPTLDPNTTACDISADVTCTVLSLEGISCDQITAPAGDTCPPDNELLVAYLKYDGSLGDSIFLEVVCDKSTTYIDRTIASGEVFTFRTRSNSCEEVSFNVYTADPEEDGDLLSETLISTACPGPWTLGASIADVFTLDAFIDTEDDGISFSIYIEEVQIQLDYVAVNTGGFALDVVESSVTELVTAADGTGSSSIRSILPQPITVGPRSQQVVESEISTINMTGRSGDIVVYTFEVGGVTSNSFALGCSDVTSQTISL